MSKLSKIPNRHNLEFANDSKSMEAYDLAVRTDIAGKLKMKAIKAGLHLVVATAKLDGENFRVGIDERGVYLGQRTNSFYIEEKNERGNFARHPHQDKFNDVAKDTLYNCIIPWLRDAFNENWAGRMQVDEVMEGGDTPRHIPDFSAGMQNVGAFIEHSATDRNNPKEDGYLITDMTFFGELVGNSMQKRFVWHHQGLDVYFFDFAVTYAYRKDGVVDAENQKTVTFGWMFLKRFSGRIAPVRHFKLVPGILFDKHGDGTFKVYELPCLWDTIFDPSVSYEITFYDRGGAAKYVGYLKDADRINPNELRPMVEKAVNYGPMEGREDSPGEGYVVSSALPSVHPFRYKNKSARFTEAHSKPRTGGRKGRANQEAYVSPFVQFVTLARVEHALEQVAEQAGVTVADLTTRHIPDMLGAIVRDVEVEENAGEALDKMDRKRVGNEAVRIFKEEILAKRV